MSVYAYAAIPDNSAVNVPSRINDYCQKHKMPLKKLVIDNQPSKAHWDKRELNHLVSDVLVKGDTLITYEAANLARSTSQVLEVLELLTKHHINLHLIKYETTFTPQEIVDTKGFLHLVQNIEEDFVTRRTTDALARRRSAGLPLGRPKGRKNKSRKLDKFQGEIKKYLALHISKASVAKLLGCHAQTLYNYLDDNPEIEQEVNASMAAAD